MPTPSLLSGRYEIHEELGSGGMATVYRGTDRVLNRTVAVKVLAERYAQDDAFVARFRREARAAARLNHPGVVAVFDTGSDDGNHYIVMEHVDGHTLATILAEQRPLPPERAAEIAERVAVALSFAHQNGFVHRDVKPGNVMITDAGDVKVVDFGIARAMAADTLTQTSTVLGTATYFSPEQAESRSVDARSDVYSLGVVLYEMLTGRAPFSGDTAVAVAFKHVREQPVPPSRLNPAVPAPLEAVVLKALAKDPSARYQSAEEFRADLERARTGRPVAAGPELPATAAMGATPTGTVAMAPLSSTAVLDEIHEAPPQPPRERRSIWPFVLAAALVIAGAALAVALIAGGGGPSENPTGKPSRSPHPTVSATTPPPSPSTEPSETPTPTSSPSPSPSPSPTPSLSPPPSPSPSLSPSPLPTGGGPVTPSPVPT